MASTYEEDCEEGDEVILCDGCNAEAHMRCSTFTFIPISLFFSLPFSLIPSSSFAHYPSSSSTTFLPILRAPSPSFPHYPSSSFLPILGAPSSSLLFPTTPLLLSFLSSLPPSPLLRYRYILYVHIDKPPTHVPTSTY